jgi:hypothetical protein
MKGGASNLTRTMTGGEAVAEMLKAHGVDLCSAWSASSCCRSTTPSAG